MSETDVTVTSTGPKYQIRARAGSHQWLGDEPVSAGGQDSGPSPMQLLLSSLGACTAITLRMYAQRKQWPLDGVEVALRLNPDGKPEGGDNDIERRIAVTGALDPEQRERLLQIANACPVHKLLAGSIRISSALSDGPQSVPDIFG